MHKVIDRLQTVLARSPACVRVALKARNQLQSIIGKSLSSGIKAATNGEDLVMSAIAPLCESFIDVGANVGDWTASFLTHNSGGAAGRLIEPNVEACNMLRTRFANARKLEILDIALGDEVGYAQFYVDGTVGETSSMVAGVTSNVTAVRTVPVSTIDALVSADERVDLLKVDAEGNDFFVLRGASSLLRSKRVKFIQFEYNSQWAPAGATLAKALRFLAEFEFDAFLIKNNGIFELDYPRYGEFYRYSNFIAVRRDLVPYLQHLSRGMV